MRRIVLLAVVLGFLAGMSIIGEAKSMYVIANHHTAQFDAWNVEAPGVDPPITYQATYNLSHAGDPAGVAVDNDSATLFITSESDEGVELVDATTMASLGWVPGARNLGGIDIDDLNDVVYAVQRGTGNLYVYAWDPTTRTLTLKDSFPKALPNCGAAFGLALDEIHGFLYVADTQNEVVRIYDVATLSEVSNFAPSFPPVGIAIDRNRKIVYTTAPDGTCASGTPTGNTLLSKYALTSGVETTVDMGHGGMGIAVDEVAGYVYVTGGCLGDDISVWDSDLNFVYSTGPIGNPAGIAIGNVSYNPLSLSKNDVLVGYGVSIGQEFPYSITFGNDSSSAITGAIIVDTLPPELDFVSETVNGTPNTGVYDPVTHTVTWDIGTLPAGYTGEIALVVRVNQSATGEAVLYNYCTIESDQTPPTTVIGGDPDSPTDEPGTYIIVNQPPDTKIETADIDSANGTAKFTWSGSDDSTPPAQLVYKHRLLNPDSPIYDWLPKDEGWSSSTTATYPRSGDSHLPDGTYRFQVKAKDADGAIQPDSATWKFTIGLEDHPPTTSASDLGGQPTTMHPNTAYSVSAKYYDPNGREDLKYCYMRLNHPEKPLTLMWYQADDHAALRVGEEGENYLTITNVEVTEIVNGSEGYELTWSFQINDQWPEVKDAIDFGVFASDDGDLESSWDYDDTNGSFAVSNLPWEVEQAVEQLRVRANDAIYSIAEDITEMWVDWVIDAGTLIVGKAAGDFVGNWLSAGEAGDLKIFAESIGQLYTGGVILGLKILVQERVNDFIQFDDRNQWVEDSVSDFMTSATVGQSPDILACIDYIESLGNSIEYYEARYHEQIRGTYDAVEQIETAAGYAKLAGYALTAGGAVVLVVSAPTGVGAVFGGGMCAVGQTTVTAATATQVITESLELILGMMATYEGTNNCLEIVESVSSGLSRVADALLDGSEPRPNARINYVGLPSDVSNGTRVPVYVSFANASDDTIQGRAWITQQYNYVGIPFRPCDIPSNVVSVPGHAVRQTSEPQVLCGNVFDLLQIISPVSLSSVTVSATGTYGFTSPMERTSNSLAERTINVENPLVHLFKDAWVGLGTWIGGASASSKHTAYPQADSERVMRVTILVANASGQDVTVRITDSIPSSIVPALEDVIFVTPYTSLNEQEREVTWEIELGPYDTAQIEYMVPAGTLSPGDPYVLPAARAAVLDSQSGALLEESSTPNVFKTVQSSALAIERVSLQPVAPNLEQPFALDVEISNSGADTVVSVFAELELPEGVSVEGMAGHAVGSLEPGSRRTLTWTLAATTVGSKSIGVRFTALNADTVSAVASFDTNSPPVVTLADNVIVAPNPVPDTGAAFFYALPEGTATAKLMIFNVAGQLLFETPLDADLTRFPSAGTWNPVDQDGTPLANGPYVYVLIADGKVIGQGKLVIQR